MENITYSSKMVVNTTDLNYIKKTETFSDQSKIFYNLEIGFKKNSSTFAFQDKQERDDMYLAIVKTVIGHTPDI